MDLENLITVVSSSVRQAQQNVEANNVAGYLNEYFEVTNDSEGTISPKTQSVCIKNLSSPKIEVPIVSLVNHSSMCLDQVKIKMNVIMSANSSNQIGVALSSGKEDGNNPITNEIELIYKRNDPSEGISRVTQETLKLF